VHTVYEVTNYFGFTPRTVCIWHISYLENIFYIRCLKTEAIMTVIRKIADDERTTFLKSFSTKKIGYVGLQY
jgi:hypothetical protein